MLHLIGGGLIRIPAALLVLMGLLSGAIAHGADPTSPRFEVPANSVLVDEPVPIAVSGLKPGASVTVRLRREESAKLTSCATFTADERGQGDLARMSPIARSYKAVDATGLFWSVEAPAGDPLQESWQVS